MSSSRQDTAPSAVALLTRSGVCRSALLFALVPVVITFLQSPRVFGVATIFASFSAFWSAMAFASTLRHQTFRSGAALVPGMRSSITLIAVGLALAIALLPLGTALAVGRISLSMVSLVLAAFAAGWWFGSLIPASQKASMTALIVGGALSLLVGIYANSLSESQKGAAWQWPDFVDPIYQQSALLLIAAAAIWFAVRRFDSMREDSLVLRMWWTRSRGGCESDSGMAGLPMAFLEFLPAFALRQLPVRDNGRTDEVRLQESLFRHSQLALSPAGLVLIYMPWVVALTIFGIHSEVGPRGMFFNPALIFLNGIVVLFGAFKPARVRRELLRPASRPELVARLAGAMRIDVLQFGAVFIPAFLALHLLLIREYMDTTAYWMGYLMLPGLAAFVCGVAMACSRFTRWAGLIGFAPAWLGVVIAIEYAEKYPSLDVAMACVGLSLVLGLVGLGLDRLGQRLWVRAELV